jgi:hypothetical protein
VPFISTLEIAEAEEGPLARGFGTVKTALKYKTLARSFKYC